MFEQIRSLLFSSSKTVQPASANLLSAHDHQDLEIDPTLGRQEAEKITSDVAVGPAISEAETGVAAKKRTKLQSSAKAGSTKVRQKESGKKDPATTKSRGISFSKLRGSDWVLPGSSSAPANMVVNHLDVFAGPP
ncbi:hypothetical protein [Hydrogenophaga sp. 2FB]|uniref:hypothetical protein n=1 Tax=Hydrogenophaga sp. 2FB TaxID=2502187 RepID=UPI0010F710FA|nr:hypothetical protein [Hydrogenophaga sp. 2FB]